MPKTDFDRASEGAESSQKGALFGFVFPLQVSMVLALLSFARNLIKSNSSLIYEKNRLFGFSPSQLFITVMEFLLVFLICDDSSAR